MPLAYIAVRCDPCDTKRSMKAVSQSPQRNARFAKSVCNAAGPTAKIIFYFQPFIGINNKSCEPALAGRQVRGWEFVIFFLRFSNNLLTPAFKLGD